MFTSFFRTVILYFMVMIALRLMGKRQIGELEPTELVVTILISELAAIPMQDLGVPLIYGIIPILTLVAIEILQSGLLLKSLRLRAFFSGKASIVIREGAMDQREMRKNRFTVDELVEELRLQGYLDLSRIKYAILETNGQLSVIPYAGDKPLTASDMNVTKEEGGLPVIIIDDGRVLSDNMSRLGIDREWLTQELRARGALEPKDAFLFMVDESKRIYYLPRGQGTSS